MNLPLPAWLARSLLGRVGDCLVLLGLAVALGLGAALAQPAADPDPKLGAIRQSVEEIERKLQDNRLTVDELADTRRRLVELGRQASAVVTEQAPLLQSAQARLDELGTAASEGEAPDVTEQRTALQKAVSQTDARLKLARLLVVTTGQLADTTAGRARERFAAEIFAPTDFLLGRRFGRNLLAGLPYDGERIRGLGRQFRTWLATTGAGEALGAATILGVALFFRLAIRRTVDRILVERSPPGRLRRSLRALANALIALVLPGGALLAVLAAGGGPGDTTTWEEFSIKACAVACFSSFSAGLLQGLLATGHPSWRLPRIPDHVALGVRRAPLWLAWTLFAGWLLRSLAEVGQLSLHLVIAVQAAASIALAAVGAHSIRLVVRLWRDPARRATPPWWLPPLGVATWLVLLLAIAAIVTGYVALGGVVVAQVVWTFILLCSAYLLISVISDLAGAAMRATGGTAAVDEGVTQASGRRAQLVVVLSGLFQLAVVLLLLVLLFAPFGEGPGQLLGRATRLREGIAIGNLQVRPAAVLNAVVVIVLSLVAVHIVQRWTARRLLPTTTLDAGMQSSISALLGFIGTVAAIAMGLSALGLALSQVAWIATALTVGIGFGLQAVVSNFVSGLILLAERPVKVGDWVAIGGLEGDIVRINVRATEIQMADRSTLIVPNSEFITKVVRNVTHDTTAQGLVQIRLPMPLDVDPEHVRRTILMALEQHEDILSHPAPRVLLDGIEGDRLVFSASGLVASPRRAAIIRSEVLFRVLGALKEPGRNDAP